MSDRDASLNESPLVVSVVIEKYGARKARRLKMSRQEAAALAQALVEMLAATSVAATGHYNIEVGW